MLYKKLAVHLLAVAWLSMSVMVGAQKADGYAYEESDTFSPGLYEAVVDARVYSDIDRNSPYKGLLIRKGTRIRVYSAGVADYGGRSQAM